MNKKTAIAATIVAGLVMITPAHAGTVAAILDVTINWWNALTSGPLISPIG